MSNHDLLPSESSSPPRPRLTLRVGVTGHRFDKLDGPASLELAGALRGLLKRIDAICGEIRTAHADVFDGETDAGGCAHAVRLVSGLAEGTDQIAAVERPANWTLDAILPMPLDAYRDHLSHEIADAALRMEALQRLETVIAASSTRLTILPPPHGKREPSAFERLRDMLIRNSDIIVAAWDGDEGSGAGGTADVVLTALQLQLPVIWLPISGGKVMLPRLFEAVPGRASFDPGPTGDFDRNLAARLRRVLAPPVDRPAYDDSARTRHGAAAPDATERLKGFLAERWRDQHDYVAYERFKRGHERDLAVEARRRAPGTTGLIDPDSITMPVSIDAGAYLLRSQENWEAFLDAAPLDRIHQGVGTGYALARTLTRTLLPRQLWADGLAVYYAHAFRSGYFRSYSLSAAAVAIALLGLVVPHEMDHGYQVLLKVALVFVELWLIGRIIQVVSRGRRERWHDKWLEYRLLAEQLRHLRMLALLGEYGSVQAGDGGDDPAHSWILWYLRATARELGPPPLLLDDAYQSAALQAVDHVEITAQIAYNDGVAPALERMEEFLHRWGDWCFKGTAIVLVVYLGLWLLYALPVAFLHASPGQAAEAMMQSFDNHVLFVMKPYVGLLAGLLPAVGAALAGVRIMGDFQGFADRARRTAMRLAELRHDYARLTPALRLEQSRALLLETAAILSEDLTIWQALYGRKPLTYPA